MREDHHRCVYGTVACFVFIGAMVGGGIGFAAAPLAKSTICTFLLKCAIVGPEVAMTVVGGVTGGTFGLWLENKILGLQTPPPRSLEEKLMYTEFGV